MYMRIFPIATKYFRVEFSFYPFFSVKKNNEKIKTKTSFFLVWQVKDEGRRSVVGFGAFFGIQSCCGHVPFFEFLLVAFRVFMFSSGFYGRK